MRPETPKYLFDIREAVDRIVEFTRGLDLQRYLTDAMRRSAAERQFEIVGEALAQMSRRDPATAAEITAQAQIIAFRNLLIHGYSEVDSRVVWDVVTTQLPTLAREVTTLLDRADRQ